MGYDSFFIFFVLLPFCIQVLFLIRRHSFGFAVIPLLAFSFPQLK